MIWGIVWWAGERTIWCENDKLYWLIGNIRFVGVMLQQLSSHTHKSSPPKKAVWLKQTANLYLRLHAAMHIALSGRNELVLNRNTIKY